MKYSELEKANEINRQIKTLQDLRRACLKPYLHICPIKYRINNLAFQDGNTIVIAEKGLSELILEYCDRRIEELSSDLEAL